MRLPVLTTLTLVVTALADLELLKTYGTCELAPVYFIEYILDISERSVDFPVPHSP